MKRFFLFIGLLVLALGILIFFLLAPHLDSTVLLNTLNETDAFKLTLFYSDVSMNKIEGFEASKNNIAHLNLRFQSYTEGFLPRSHTKNILSSINTFRKSRGENLLTYFHDYYEDDDWMIISFTGGLESIYFIDKETWVVSLLHYAEGDNLGKMYVSHIRRIADTFVLIGGQVNAYSAFVYTIDAKTHSVIKAKSLDTHTSAISEEHYTIDAQGNAVFISGNGMDILAYQSKTSAYQPLPFEAHYVFSSGVATFVLSLNTEILHYALLDNKLGLSHIGTLPLPNKNVIIVDAYLKDNYLYMLSFDPTHKLYRNYVTVYNIDSDKLIYCLALHQYKSLALLKGEF